jgi:hypothetical protein
VGPGGVVVGAPAAYGVNEGQGNLLVGVAVDVGGQYVTRSGFLISGGTGFSFSNEVPRLNLFGSSQSSDFVVLPRLLFSVGQAL